MPRIPMSDKAGFIPRQRANAPMQGAPGMGFKMEEHSILARAGERIADGVGRAASAVTQFQMALQDQDNKLAAAQDRALLNERQNALISQLADNPTADEKTKQQWIGEFNRKLAEDRKPFLDKMSGDFRETHDLEVSTMAKDFAFKQSLVLKQSAVQARYKLTGTLLRDSAIRGDFNEYKRILDGARGTVFSEEEHQARLLDYHRLAESAAAKRLVEDGSGDIVERLKKQNDDGSYAEFTHLAESDRNQLVASAIAANGRREANEDHAVMAAYAAGNLRYSDEKLDALHDDGVLSDRQYHSYKKWNREFQEERLRAADHQASVREKAAKASRVQQIDRLLNHACYDESGKTRVLDELRFAEAKDKAQDICGADYGLYNETLKKLNDQTQKDVAFRNTPLYKDGELYLASLKAQGMLTANIDGWLWDSTDRKPATTSLLERSLRMDLENYVQDHPGASTLEMQNFMTERTALYNKSTVAQIGNLAMRGTAAKAGEKKMNEAGSEGKSGTFNGKKIIFKQGKWEYAE